MKYAWNRPRESWLHLGRLRSGRLGGGWLRVWDTCRGWGSKICYSKTYHSTTCHSRREHSRLIRRGLVSAGVETTGVRHAGGFSPPVSASLTDTAWHVIAAGPEAASSSEAVSGLGCYQATTGVGASRGLIPYAEGGRRRNPMQDAPS